MSSSYHLVEDVSQRLSSDSRPRRVGGWELCVVLMLLMIFGTANFLLVKVLYSVYGEERAFFVSQGINVIYVLYGGLVVYPRLVPWGFGDAISAAINFGPITPAMRRSPQGRFVAMGLLDCFGTFFTALGAVYTPGQFQTLLNQSLVPCTLVVSAIFLRARYSLAQILAAALIVSGAVLSIAPQIAKGAQVASGNADEVRLYAVIVYWFSNVPMALSAVYKEARFTCEKMDVCYLTQWVSVYQMLFGFILAPLLTLPGLGSAHGIPPGEIMTNFESGFRCFAELEDSGCSGRYTFLLLWLYVAVNFCFNTLGLWLTKHAGAVLNSITYALLLPLTTVAFSFDFLGPFKETAHLSTFLGLGVVLFGFTLWRYFETPEPAREASGSELSPKPPLTASRSVSSTNISSPVACEASQESFQERVIIGLSIPHRARSKSVG